MLKKKVSISVPTKCTVVNSMCSHSPIKYGTILAMNQF